ncbi:hypothetical protein D3C75_1256860 [compost metagenome]
MVEFELVALDADGLSADARGRSEGIAIIFRAGVAELLRRQFLRLEQTLHLVTIVVESD